MRGPGSVDQVPQPALANPACDGSMSTMRSVPRSVDEFVRVKSNMKAHLHESRAEVA